MSITEVEKAYKAIIDPFNFFKDWTGVEFQEWCEMGTVEDLEYLNAELIRCEMYELCVKLKKVIESKKAKQ